MTLLPTLLAEADPSTWREYFLRSSTSQEFLVILLFGVGIAAVWIGIFLWDRHRKSLPVVAARASLFEELCQAHGLRADEVESLSRAAEDNHLTDAAFLFVQPEYLEPFDQETDAGLVRLRERLFGSLDNAVR